MDGRENKRQQERKLEEFRSFRTSKRQKKRRKQRSDEEKLKLRIVLCVGKTQVRNQATKL